MSATVFYFIDDWDGAFTVSGRSLHTLGYHQTGDYTGHFQAPTLAWTAYGGATPVYFYTHEFLATVTIVGETTSTINWEIYGYPPRSEYVWRCTIGKRTAAGVETDIVTSVETDTDSAHIHWPSTSFAQGDRMYVYFEIDSSKADNDPIYIKNTGTHLDLPVAVTAGNIVKPAAFYYQTLTNVTKDATMLWHVYKSLYKDAVIDYHTLGAVATTGTMLWDTESTLTEVSVDAEFLYDTLAWVSKDGAFTYNTMIAVMQSMLHVALYLSAYTDLQLALSQHTDLKLEEVA